MAKAFDSIKQGLTEAIGHAKGLPQEGLLKDAHPGCARSDPAGLICKSNAVVLTASAHRRSVARGFR